MAPCRHETFRTIRLSRIAESILAGSTVISSVPSEPVAIHLGSVFDQDRALEVPRRARPRSQVVVEFALNDSLQGKDPLGFARFMILRSHHQANVRHSAVSADPLRGR